MNYKMFGNNKIILFSGSILIVILGVILILHFMSSNSSIIPDIEDNFKDYNLIIINIDALRADHLGCYGYHRNTSPFIDSLSQKGIVFEQAFSNSSFTQESVSVLLSGKLPSSGNSVGWGAKPSGEIKNIGELFKQAGYRTGFFSNTNVLKNRNFSKGFIETWHCDKWGVSGNGPELSMRAVEFVRKCNGQKFMMYLHYLDPHGPYRAPRRLYLRFAKKIYPKPLPLYKYVRKKCFSLIKEGFGPGDIRFEDMVLRYDAEIAHTDKSIKLLFKRLEELNLLNKTFVVITADHGEEFLEHNFVEHAWTLYNESLHIPLVFWAPGTIYPKRITSRVSTVDVLPTLLELMRISHKRDDFDGRHLFEYKKKGFYFSPPTKPFIAELLIQHRSLIRAVIKDDWKYIAAQKWLEPRERPEVLQNVREFEDNKALHLDIWGPVVHEELYDLTTDPAEKRNLLVKQRAKRLELQEILKIYRIYCRQKGLKTTPDGKKTPLTKEEIEKLKSLGYL